MNPDELIEFLDACEVPCPECNGSGKHQKDDWGRPCYACGQIGYRLTPFGHALTEFILRHCTHKICDVYRYEYHRHECDHD